MHFKILFATAISLIAGSALAEENKWQPIFELEGRTNSDRSLASPKFFIPLIQNESSMLFTDIRSRFDDNDSEEYNIGLGYRTMNTNWIFGGYIFGDYLRSTNNFGYWQGTAGLEALSENWDLRINSYLPEAGKNGIGNAAPIGLVIDGGGNFGISGGIAGAERALPGFDGEIGYKLPINNFDLRAFAGAYYFDAKDFNTVSGPKARLELTLNQDNVSFFSNGMELTFGAQYQNDDEREDTFTGLIQFKFPFYGEAPSTKLTKLEKRMSNFIERDVDVITSSKPGTTSFEAATIDINGQQYSKINTTINGNTANAQTALTNAGTYSLIVLDGSQGAINNTGVLNVSNGQALIGGGAAITATGSNSGLTVNGNLPGTRPQVNAGIYLNSTQDVTLKSFNITPPSTFIGVHMSANSGDIVDDVNINGTGSGTQTVLVENNSNNNIFRNMVLTTDSEGMFMRYSNNINSENIEITSAGNVAVIMEGMQNSILDQFKIGNTVNGGILMHSNSDHITLSNSILGGTTHGTIHGDAIIINNVTNSGGDNISVSANGLCTNLGTNTGTSFKVANVQICP